MNPAGIILVFVLLTIVGIAGIALAGFGVRRLQQETVVRAEAKKSTVVRCCGVDLLISLVGMGLVFFGAFSAFRIVLG